MPAKGVLQTSLLSEEFWIAAIVQHERVWREGEGDLFKAMQQDCPAATRITLGFYRVARNVRNEPEIRNRLRALVYKVRIRGKSSRARLEGFAEHVERIARKIGVQQDRGRRKK